MRLFQVNSKVHRFIYLVLPFHSLLSFTTTPQVMKYSQVQGHEHAHKFKHMNYVMNLFFFLDGDSVGRSDLQGISWEYLYVLLWDMWLQNNT